MKFIYITSAIISIHLLATGHVLAQKPVIDTSIYGKWSRVGPAFINIGGEYIYYENYDKTGCRVTIKGTHNAWGKEISDVKGQVSFANEGHLLITKRGQDSLCLQTLGSDQQECISPVASFDVSKSGKAEWLLYQLNSPGNELISSESRYRQTAVFFQYNGLSVQYRRPGGGLAAASW